MVVDSGRLEWAFDNWDIISWMVISSNITVAETRMVLNGKLMAQRGPENMCSSAMATENNFEIWIWTPSPVRQSSVAEVRTSSQKTLMGDSSRRYLIRTIDLLYKYKQVNQPLIYHNKCNGWHFISYGKESPKWMLYNTYSHFLADSSWPKWFGWRHRRTTRCVMRARCRSFDKSAMPWRTRDLAHGWW